MMLSRTGWDKTPLPVACQTVEGRRAPWGCAAGAPYRGTASPPPPPWLHVCDTILHDAKTCTDRYNKECMYWIHSTEDHIWHSPSFWWLQKGGQFGCRIVSGFNPEMCKAINAFSESWCAISYQLFSGVPLPKNFSRLSRL